MGAWGRSALLPVEDIKGIGPQTAQTLSQYGVGSVQELSALSPGQADDLADLVAGLSTAGMRRAVAEAAFHLLGQDGADAAAVLVDAGFTSALALVAAQTTRVENLTGLDTPRALGLQLQAARAGLTFQALLHVVDGDGAPVVCPVVEVGNAGLGGQSPVTVREGDDQGWVLTPPLRRDRAHRLFVIADGQRRMVRLVAAARPVLRRTFVLREKPRSVSTLSGKPVVLGRGQFAFEDLADSDVDGGVFRIGATEAGETSLHTVVRSFVPFGVVTGVLRVPASDVPGSEGEFVVRDAGVWRVAAASEQEMALRSRGGALIGRWPS